MKKRIFTGSGIAIITPMHEDGSVNYEEFARLIDYQIANKTDAIIVCGTTGEGATLSEEEHLDCIRFVNKYVDGRVPVIAGAGSNDTAFAISMIKECEKIGVDGLLVVTPYYNKTSQRGLVAHYKALAAATTLPIILYSVPSRTGLNITPAACKELSKVENIVAIKEASGNMVQVSEIKALCGDDLDVYSGEDNMILPMLSVGGIGVISVMAHVIPQETHDLCQKFFDGDVKGAAKIQLENLDLVSALFSDVNPIPVKAAMNMMGWNVGHCRMPLIDMAPEAEAKLADTLRKHGLIN